MRGVAAIAVVLAALGNVPVGEGSVDPVFGYWQTENGRAIVAIEACGSEACGRMVWLADPVEADGTPKRDPRGRPLCGLPLVEGLEREDVGRWADGSIYNPRDGRTYSVRVEALDAERIDVRGYAALPLFGKSQVWTRAAGDNGGC